MACGRQRFESGRTPNGPVRPGWHGARRLRDAGRRRPGRRSDRSGGRDRPSDSGESGLGQTKERARDDAAASSRRPDARVPALAASSVHTRAGRRARLQGQSRSPLQRPEAERASLLPASALWRAPPVEPLRGAESTTGFRGSRPESNRSATNPRLRGRRCRMLLQEAECLLEESRGRHSRLRHRRGGLEPIRRQAHLPPTPHRHREAQPRVGIGNAESLRVSRNDCGEPAISTLDFRTLGGSGLTRRKSRPRTRVYGRTSSAGGNSAPVGGWYLRGPSVAAARRATV